MRNCPRGMGCSRPIGPLPVIPPSRTVAPSGGMLHCVDYQFSEPCCTASGHALTGSPSRVGILNMVSMASRLLARSVSFARGSRMMVSALFVAVCVLAGLALPGVASAQVEARSISGSFQSGGSISGTYSYNVATGEVSAVNISLTADGSGPAVTMIQGHRFTSTDIVFCSTNPCSLPSVYVYAADAVAGPGSTMTSGTCTSVGPGTLESPFQGVQQWCRHPVWNLQRS